MHPAEEHALHQCTSLTKRKPGELQRARENSNASPHATNRTTRKEFQTQTPGRLEPLPARGETARTSASVIGRVIGAIPLPDLKRFGHGSLCTGGRRCH